MLLSNARCCATRTTLSLSSACAAAFQPLPALLILVRVLYSSDCHTNARTHSTPHVQRAVDASSSTSLSFPLVWMSWSLEEEATRTTLSLSSACAAAFQPLPALLILVRVLYSSDCHTNARTHSTPHVQRAVDASSSTSLSFPLVWMSWSLEEEAEGTSPPPVRRSIRERQEPVRLQAEQEGEALSRDEAADVEVALLLSLQGDDEKGEDAVDIASAPPTRRGAQETRRRSKPRPLQQVHGTPLLFY